MSITAIILAGGLGTRMNSSIPKVLHTVNGGTMIEAIVYNLSKINPEEIIIVGSDLLFSNEMWQKTFEQLQKRIVNVKLVIQERPLGTGHAVQIAFPHVSEKSDKIIICSGDTPFLTSNTFKNVSNCNDDITISTMRIENLKSTYGRVIIENENVKSIIEYKDANDEQRNINIANAGMYCTNKDILNDLIYKIEDNNKAKEFYLTDIVKLANQKNIIVGYIDVNSDEAYGIDTIDALYNSPGQELLKKIAIKNGVFFQDPKSTILSFDTEISKGAIISSHNVFGKNVTIDENVEILPFCYLENCHIKNNSVIGPYARIKENSVIEQDCVIGNFVEIKKSQINEKTKIKHLSYVGDAIVGKSVNIGAGTIFCNYDGFKKHQTIVKDFVKIGANNSIVAPLTIGESSFTGAGSVITRDVPEQTLAISRSEQKHSSTWLRRKRS